MKLNYYYDSGTHTTTCVCRGKHKTYVGTSQCHEHDYEFESKLVGQEIALTRAAIQEIIDARDDAHQRVIALRHVYDILDQNEKVDNNSFECRMIKRQLTIQENELAALKEVLKDMRSDLNDTIKQKETLYKKLKAMRNAGYTTP